MGASANTGACIPAREMPPCRESAPPNVRPHPPRARGSGRGRAAAVGSRKVGGGGVAAGTVMTEWTSSSAFFSLSFLLLLGDELLVSFPN